jgi:hypothetical protein
MIGSMRGVMPTVDVSKKKKEERPSWLLLPLVLLLGAPI